MQRPSLGLKLVFKDFFLGGEGGRNFLVDFFGWKDFGRDFYKGFLCQKEWPLWVTFCAVGLFFGSSSSLIGLFAANSLASIAPHHSNCFPPPPLYN